jgi:hypothetical protein
LSALRLSPEATKTTGSATKTTKITALATKTTKVTMRVTALATKITEATMNHRGFNASSCFVIFVPFVA